MTEHTSTYGDFWNEVAQTTIVEGQAWMDDWRKLARLENDDDWLRVRQMELTPELVINFAEDVVMLFQERMKSICTDQLYNTTLEHGHAFLQEIQAAAAKFNVDVGSIISTPITPAEAVARK